jgi:hypothetical protein
MAKALTLLPRECQLYRTGKSAKRWLRSPAPVILPGWRLEILSHIWARSDILFLRFGTWLHKAASAGCTF